MEDNHNEKQKRTSKNNSGRTANEQRRKTNTEQARRTSNEQRRGNHRTSRLSDDEGKRPYRPRKSAEGIIHNRTQVSGTPVAKKNDGTVRLNKYISNAGICSRRDADQLIQAGAVSVNGKVVTTLGYKVQPGDVVSYGGQVLRSEAKRYFLLNKPKGYITTLDDPQERKTVMMLVQGCCRERIYPVGRLDKDTTGLLLFTNDGELAKRLTHPSSNVYKIYMVECDKAVTHSDMRQMIEGVELEDGFAKFDDIQYQGNSQDRRVVGVAIHSGKNRIVRRIFEHFGYKVHKLDRTVFAGLTKKDLPRGKVRELTSQEVNFLMMV